MHCDKSPGSGILRWESKDVNGWVDEDGVGKDVEERLYSLICRELESETGKMPFWLSDSYIECGSWGNGGTPVMIVGEHFI